MDNAQRVLLQVTLEDAAAADEMFAVLMGEDVEFPALRSSSATPRTSGSWTSEAGYAPSTLIS